MGIWKPIPTFPIGKELKQQISSQSANRWLAPSLKQYVKIERRKIEILFNIHYSLLISIACNASRGMGEATYFLFDYELLYRVYSLTKLQLLKKNLQI